VKNFQIEYAAGLIENLKLSQDQLGQVCTRLGYPTYQPPTVTTTPWGYIRELWETHPHPTDEYCYKVREVTILPEQCLPFQRHILREMHCTLVYGTGQVHLPLDLLGQNSTWLLTLMLGESGWYVARGHWYQIRAGKKDRLVYIETQSGIRCEDVDCETDGNEWRGAEEEVKKNDGHD